MYEQLVKRGAAACVALGLAVVALATQTPAQAADAWSSSTDCATCHASQVQTVEGTTHEILACVGCHTDEEALADVHKDVDESTKTPRRLKKTAVTEATCLGCHGDGMIAAPQVAADDTASDADTEANAKDEKATDTATATTKDAANDAQANDADTTSEDEEVIPHEALIAATATSTVLTDEHGTTVNPHDLPAVEDHASITCVSCHKGHTSDTIEESAMKACILCHHENIFECYTCHE